MTAHEKFMVAMREARTTESADRYIAMRRAISALNACPSGKLKPFAMSACFRAMNSARAEMAR
jgi:hypothetical protein